MRAPHAQVMTLPRPSYAVSEQAQLAIREVLSHHDLNQASAGLWRHTRCRA
jgi:hypothetical protein